MLTIRGQKWDVYFFIFSTFSMNKSSIKVTKIQIQIQICESMFTCSMKSAIGFHLGLSRAQESIMTRREKNKCCISSYDNSCTHFDRICAAYKWMIGLLYARRVLKPHYKQYTGNTSKPQRSGWTTGPICYNDMLIISTKWKDFLVPIKELDIIDLPDYPITRTRLELLN